MTYKCKIDLTKSIDWQRGSAEQLIKKLKLKQDWYQNNHCDFWNNWITDVFDLRTANEFGLSVWSVILEVPLFGESASVIDGLTIDQKRIMLQLKAFSMHSVSSTYEINKKLAELFGFRSVYVLDNLDMSYTYVISNTELKKFIDTVKDFDLLPRPNSVSVNTVISSNSTPFLFGDKRDNFGRGNFHIGIN